MLEEEQHQELGTGGRAESVLCHEALLFRTRAKESRIGTITGAMWDMGHHVKNAVLRSGELEHRGPAYVQRRGAC